MTWIASFDIGSSAVKAALVTRDGALHAPRTVAYPAPARALQATEQDPMDWWSAFRAVLVGWWADGVAAHEIAAIALSGQMQNLIAVDADGMPVQPALLHADARGEAEAVALRQALGAATIQQVTRNPFNATSVLPKIEQLRHHDPEAWARTAQVLVGAKDFITLQLTGHAVTDPTTAATTGMFNIESGRWQLEWLDAIGLESQRLPQLLDASALAGHVTEPAAAATGLAPGCPVLCGIGDAGATTLGAGVADATQCYAYLGTSAWVARVSSEFNPPDLPLFVLPYLHAKRRILIGPVSNAGGVHRWALELLDRGAGASEAERFAAFEAAVRGTATDPRLLFLPYLSGERLPVVTARPSGTFCGLSTSSTRAQMMRATLEGVSLSLRWALDLLGGAPASQLVVVGGATRSDVWMQILADVFDIELRVAEDGELQPCLGAAALAATKLGWSTDPETFVHRRRIEAPRRFAPEPAAAALMRRKSAAQRALQAAIAPMIEHVHEPYN